MMDSVDFNVAFINILIDLKEKQHNEERNEWSKKNKVELL
jgi:hypothetical protein